MGVGVATLLAADEIEHHRCGIACVLENAPSGGVSIQRIIRGGSADNTALQEGDVLLEVDGHNVQGLGVAEASDFIRGKEGSYVVIKVLKHSGEVGIVHLQRQRVPGSKAELLGALWQQQGQGKKKVWTEEDKIGKLDELYRRGNLSRTEYDAAIARIKTGAPHSAGEETVNNESVLGSVWDALVSDIAVLTEDPDVRRLKLSREGSMGGTSTAASPQHLPPTPQHNLPSMKSGGGPHLTDKEISGFIHTEQDSPTSSTWVGWSIM